MKHRKHLIEAKIVSEHVVWFLFADGTPSFQGNQWTPTQSAIFAVLNCAVNRGEYKPVQRPLNLSVPNNVFQHESRRLDYCKGLAPKRIWGYFMPLWFREISHGYCCSCWWIISCTSWRSKYPRCFKCEPSRMVAWFFLFINSDYFQALNQSHGSSPHADLDDTHLLWTHILCCDKKSFVWLEKW